MIEWALSKMKSKNANHGGPSFIKTARIIGPRSHDPNEILNKEDTGAANNGNALSKKLTMYFRRVPAGARRLLSRLEDTTVSENVLGWSKLLTPGDWKLHF